MFSDGKRTVRLQLAHKKMGLAKQRLLELVSDGDVPHRVRDSIADAWREVQEAHVAVRDALAGALAAEQTGGAQEEPEPQEEESEGGVVIALPPRTHTQGEIDEDPCLARLAWPEWRVVSVAPGSDPHNTSGFYVREPTGAAAERRFRSSNFVAPGDDVVVERWREPLISIEK